jgi:endogenous inhibitor of DNA gyrase (YacG/DUF329 family)
LNTTGPSYAKNVTDRPSGFRKAPKEKALSEAPQNASGQMICPTCGQVMKNPDMDHFPTTWAQRVKQLFNPTRKEVLDLYNKDIRAQCPTCNRSHKFEGDPGKYAKQE